MSIFLIISMSCGDHDTSSEKIGRLEPLGGWELVWHDEFNDNAIDSTKWEHEVNAWGGGNNELQYYTSRQKNSHIQNGCLVIQALRETYSGVEGFRGYTSARLKTKMKGEWKDGRFEIRAKLPIGKGVWPAIWLLPTENIYGGWAASGEIDIMELVGHIPNTVHGTIHYGSEWPENVHTGGVFSLDESDFSRNFHNFMLDWEKNEFRWYVDGVLYQTQEKWYSASNEYPAPFNQKFYLILNVAVGGNWPGSPDSTTIFPQKMIIDYVRVYQKK